MKTGDIHWVELPHAGGREQSGRRPAVIMQEDEYAFSLPTTIVIPLSSAIAALRFPGTSQVKATTMSGLRADSVALAFQIRAIDRHRIKEHIGIVSPAELVEIREELRKLFGN
ncbi:MAG: type II toxin-antitoxin system PemK/MazF family toxin [Planctomycetes bacterium]|nr:type II toxin-antitoxin system PemK/MazF family toxin [Planctomycetota bacterium]